MRCRPVVLGMVACAAFFSAHGRGAEPTSEELGGSAKPTFWLIPHTHWEGAVFKTLQQYLDIGLSNILQALRLLEQYPDYRFVLDQVCYVKPFLQRYPEQEAAFRRLVTEGRLQLVAGTDVMPDVNMPSGESFVRQMLYGKEYYQRKLGVDVTVGWQLDTFGHHAQMPQLLARAGYGSFWFFRGVPRPDTSAEFLWEGLDGTRIPAFWTPTCAGYAMCWGCPENLVEFNSFIQKQFDALTPFSHGPDWVALVGPDVAEPEPQLPAMVEEFNR